MKNFSLISRAAISGVFAALALCAPAAFAVNLAGSDLLAGEPEKLLKALNEKTPGGLNLKLDGSLMGEKYLRDGTADAALLMLPDKNAVKEIAAGEWEAMPVACQAVVVIVGATNKLEQIDFETLAGIFGKAQAKDIARWNDVKGSNLDMPIFCVSTPRDVGISVTIFQNRVMKGGEFKSNVSFLTSDNAAVESVMTTANTIALVSTPPAGDRVKVLPVATAGGNAYKPTESNLYNGDYTLQIPLYLVFPKKNRGKISPAAPVIFGDEMAGMLKKSGFVSVPKNLRTNFIQKLDKGS